MGKNKHAVHTNPNSGSTRVMRRDKFKAIIEQAIEAALRSDTPEDPFPAEQLRIWAETAERAGARAWMVRTLNMEACGCPLAQNGVQVFPRLTMREEGLEPPTNAMNQFATVYDRLVSATLGTRNPVVLIIRNEEDPFAQAA